MNYKKKILQEMEKKEYYAMDIQQWVDFFALKNVQEIKHLQQAFQELEQEYLVVLSKKQKYLLASSQGYFQGKIQVNKKGFGFVDFEDQPSIFVGGRNLNGAMDQDLVIVKQHIPSDHGEVVKILERSVKTLVGVILCKRKPVKFIPDDTRIHSKIKLTNLVDYHLVHGQKVQVEIDEYSEKELTGRIVKILGHENDPGVDVLSILLTHQINPEFPEEVLKQAQEIPNQVSEQDIEGRVDLRDRLIVTIDGEDAKDLDDAISLEMVDGFYRLGVHIADVSHYVTENSPLDIEAYERGTSTYVVDRVVPMLPHVLSNGICSLNPRVDRLTLSCIMDIDETGDITNYQIVPSVIKTTERMTYTDVNKFLKGNKGVLARYEHLGDLFYSMRRLAKIIRKRREQAGSIDFDKEEAKIIVDKKGKVIEIGVRERGESERIIEDFMICANECVARHTKWLESPSLYRVHEKPEAKKVREFSMISSMLGFPLKGNPEEVYPKMFQQLLAKAKNSEEYPVLSLRLLRTMQKARYDRECLGHFGLGLKEYTHFTSPIRRYPDLVVHRMLREYCFKDGSVTRNIHQDELKMEDYAKQSSLRERYAVDAERDVEDMKKAEYMQQFIGRKFEGIISGVTNFGFFVQLPNTVEGLVHVDTLENDHYEVGISQLELVGARTKNRYKIGQKVLVKVVDANKRERTIDFICLTKNDNRKKRK